MNISRLRYLVDRFDQNQIAEAEFSELFNLAKQPAQQENIENVLLEKLYAERGERLNRQQLDHILKNILARNYATSSGTPAPHQVHFLKATWLRYAAAILLLFGVGTYIYIANQPQKEVTKDQAFLPTRDIAPGGNKAILTLADGRTIILDSAADGSLAEQGTTKIVKLEGGSLAYNAGSSTSLNVKGELLYNTVSTPKGGQYQIVLPDGSKVWLNAASSIRFPTAFVKERKVTVTGEVYFEVVKDKSKPFQVTTNNIQVQVLGTSFNINAYSDEPFIKTTLLEGSVRIIKDKEFKMLQPGQQAILKENDIAIDKNINLDQVMAWKNGIFNFDGATLDEFMRQLARWYDLEIVYKSQIPKRAFQGELGRDLQLSQVIEVLTQFNIKFKREGRKLIIE